jgi:hypothetical protein
LEVRVPSHALRSLLPQDWTIMFLV